MIDFPNDNGTEYDDNEIEDNDDKIEDNDEEHNESQTQREGKQFLKEKHSRTADHVTVSANPLDADVLATPESVHEEIEVRRGNRGGLVRPG